VLLAPRRPQLPCMLSAAPKEEDGYRSLLAGDFTRTKRNAKRQTTKATDSFGVCLRPHPLGIARNLECRDVRHFGRSRSDSFDACGLAGESGGVLDVCFVQLVARQCLAHAVPYLFAFGVWRTLPGMKLTGREKGNDDRRPLYLGSQRSSSTLRGGSAQKPCGNRIFEFAKAWSEAARQII
jgi:hypothetical protein